MVEVATNTKVTINADEICNDPESIKTKEKVMKKQGVNALFGSIGNTAQFLAGILSTVGMALALPAFVTAFTPAGATLGMAFAAVPVTGLAILGAAVIATAVAIGAGYVSSRMYNSANYDALEVNAKHTAQEIARALKKEVPSVATQEHEHNCRADGKKWAIVIRAHKHPEIAQAEQPQL